MTTRRRAKELAARLRDARLEVEAAQLILERGPAAMAAEPIRDAVGELESVLEELEAGR